MMTRRDVLFRLPLALPVALAGWLESSAALRSSLNSLLRPGMKAP